MQNDSMCCFRNSSESGYRILWEITNRCNQNCFFCHAKGHNDVSIEDAEKIISNLSGINIKDFILTGGEPMLNKDIFKILELLVNCGYKVDMCTNATMIDDKSALILSRYLSEVSVSLDTLDHNTYTFLRGKDMLHQVCDGIKCLLNSHIEVHLTCVVSKITLEHLEEIAFFAENIGAHTLSFLRVIPSISLNHEMTMRIALTDQDCQYAMQIIEECRKRYKIAIKTKRLKDYSHCEACEAGRKILGITGEGTLVNCIMNRDSTSIDLLNNKISDKELSILLPASTYCVV